MGSVSFLKRACELPLGVSLSLAWGMSSQKRLPVPWVFKPFPLRTHKIGAHTRPHLGGCLVSHPVFLGSGRKLYQVCLTPWVHWDSRSAVWAPICGGVVIQGSTASDPPREPVWAWWLRDSGWESPHKHQTRASRQNQSSEALPGHWD